MIESLEELTATVEREVMACIGCNDCLLACPLPQAQAVTIAELNAAVEQGPIVNPKVIDFVTACTQCQQCVPVCPADLSRADMALFNKLKVEDAIPDQPLMLQIGSEVTYSEWTLDGMAELLSQMPLFQGAPQDALRRLALKCTLRQLAPQEVLCREGEYHERLFVILEGRLEQSMSSRGEKSTRILVLGPGCFHGELAVMANQAEPFTLTALGSAVVLEIPKFALHQLMRLAPTFKSTMEGLYSRRAVWTHAQRSPLFSGLPDGAAPVLFGEARLEVVIAGEPICREGDILPDLILVRSGFLRVSREFRDRQERVLVYFREGDVFGGLEALQGETVPYSVQANTRAELIRVPGSALGRFFARFPEAREKLQREVLSARQLLPALPPSPQEPSPAGTVENTTQTGLSWTGLIDLGVIQSHEVLVIDQKLCTNCNNCVDACGRRHGHSRLDRSGLQLGSLLFPSACRHCEDPVCLLCSVNGIVRLPNGEITIVADNCIGCGACAERCPYDNILMHPLAGANEEPESLFRKFSRTLLAGQSEEERQSEDKGPAIAVKCDLCAGYEDYACVTACPVGAAFRIDPVEAFGRGDLLIGLEMKRNKE